LRPEHFDVHMAIDEKHINGQFYTVLSNAKRGKVALLCLTIKVSEVKICLDKFGQKLKEVSYLTLDLSPTFERVVNNNFPNSVQIADKFHVIKNGIEAVQAIRIRLKQEELKLQREAKLHHQKNYRESKDRDLIPKRLNNE
jgi:transposase